MGSSRVVSRWTHLLRSRSSLWKKSSESKSWKSRATCNVRRRMNVIYNSKSVKSGPEPRKTTTSSKSNWKRSRLSRALSSRMPLISWISCSRSTQTSILNVNAFRMNFQMRRSPKLRSRVSWPTAKKICKLELMILRESAPCRRNPKTTKPTLLEIRRELSSSLETYKNS